MKCAVHSDVDAVGYCRNCGKAMCSTCVRPVRDVLYCEECLATIVGIPAPTPPISTPVAESQYQMPASGLSVFFFNDTATTEIYTLSLHDALPIWEPGAFGGGFAVRTKLFSGPETR